MCLIATANVLRAVTLERAEEVVDEREAEDHRGEEPDDGHIRSEAEQETHHVQSAAALAEDLVHLLRIRMLREGVVAQEPLVHPSEDDEWNDRPERREQPPHGARGKKHKPTARRT